MEGLCENLDAKEGQKDIYNCSSHISGSNGHMINTYNKECNGRSNNKYKTIMERWGQYFKWLMNDEKPR